MTIFEAKTVIYQKDTLSCLLLLERRTENSPKKTLQMLILLQWLCDLATPLPVPQKCTFLDEK